MASPLDPDDTLPERRHKTPKGHDVRALGPGDSSDTGADMAGATLPGGTDNTSDRNGTGERVSTDQQRPVHAGEDIDTDRVVHAEDAGLGDGLDEAEQAWLEHERGLH
jgi:hypothetical protein